MTVVHQRHIEQLIREMDTVAVVGNGTTLLRSQRGHEIDQHRYVFRINAGIPTTAEQIASLGRRTSFLAVGKHSLFIEAMRRLGEQSQELLGVIYMKPSGMSDIGDNGWSKMERSCPAQIPLWQYGMDLELRCREVSGTNLSTGPRLADWLLRYVRPRQTDLYGFDFFGVDGPVESWYRPTKGRPHDGAKEKAYIQKMGYRLYPNNCWRRNT